jgi:hypothetical protein
LAGIGRSTFRKELDIFVKTRLIQQSTGTHGSPVSVLLVAGGMEKTEQYFSNPKPGFSDRSSAYLQLIAGRKFNTRCSIQLNSILLYSGTPVNIQGDQWLAAVGAGARFKVSKRVALTLDYHYPLADLDSVNTQPLSVGVDIETGGHVFQLHFSNAAGMNERAFLAETTGAFLKEIYVLDLICLVYFNWVKGGLQNHIEHFFGLSGTLPYLRLPFLRS